nr:ion transporter [Gammaproteobacteria bacterium]
MPTTGSSGWRAWLGSIVEGERAQAFITVLITVNAVTLGLETSKQITDHIGAVLLTADRIILSVFVVEITLRVIARGSQFFRDPWSLFDFSVVAIALVPTTDELAVLRALRVLRVLRLISIIPHMRRVVGGLLAAIPGLSSIVGILMLLFYVFAVIATKLFGEAFPQWFGTLGNSMYTLFQIMTLESWSMGIVRPVMEVYGLAWLFFVPFILATTFTVLNLFIAIIVSAMESERRDEEEQTVAAVTHVTDEMVRAIHTDMQAMRRQMNEMHRHLERLQLQDETLRNPGGPESKAKVPAP